MQSLVPRVSKLCFDRSIQVIINFLASRASTDQTHGLLAQPKQRGASIMQPLAPLDGGTAAAAAAQPGTEAFATMAAEDVRPDAAFFHKFYAAKAASGGGARQKKRTRLGDDGDSEDSEAEIGACLPPA